MPIFGLSFCVHALLLLGLWQEPADLVMVLRMAAGAAAAALYAVFVFRIPEWGSVLIWLLAMLVSGLLCFGWRAGRRIAYYLLLSFAVSATAFALEKGQYWMLPLYLAGIMGLLGISAKYSKTPAYPLVEVADCGKRVRFRGLYDTGNELTDPVSGEGVMVVSEKIARELTDLTRTQLQNPIAALAEGAAENCRLIPYKSVGIEGGMLLGKRYQHVRINGRERTVILAFAPNGLGEEKYQALIGKPI